MLGNDEWCLLMFSVLLNLLLTSCIYSSSKYVTAFVFSSSTDPDTSDKTAEQTKSSMKGLQATGTYICMFLQFTNKFCLFCWELKYLLLNLEYISRVGGYLLYRLYRYVWNQRVLDHFCLNLGTSLRNWCLKIGISL